MKEINLDGAWKYHVEITEEERAEGVVLKLKREDFDEKGELHLNVVFSLKDSVKNNEVKQGRPIEGHPNCNVGDCIDCHNVSCAIYQGYEPMP